MSSAIYNMQEFKEVKKKTRITRDGLTDPNQKVDLDFCIFVLQQRSNVQVHFKQPSEGNLA